PSSYCLLVSKTPIVPSPIHEASESMEDLPGNLNNGRMILVINVPNNSSSPKFINNGSANPANKNTANNTCNKSSNNWPPVSAPYMASGPHSKKTIILKTAARTRVIVQNGLT